MKKLHLLLLILPFLSCSIDSINTVNHDLSGDWVLVQTSGQVPNSTQTGADMPFQETYSLKSNGTFEKTRITDGEVLKSSGTIEIKERSEEMSRDDVLFHVYFHHHVRSLLVGTCYANSSTEHLFLTNRGRLISSYNQCDGMGLEYEKSTKSN